MTWQIVGFVTYFEFSRHQIQKEVKTLIKKGVPEDELVHFEFSKKDYDQLKWFDQKEFSYKGKMYDVVKSVQLNRNTVLISCISDYQEKQLFKNLGDTVSKKLSDEQDSPISILLDINQWQVFQNNFSFELFFFKLATKKPIFYYLNPKSTLDLSIQAPPPRFS